MGISYDSTRTLREFAEKREISFPLLSDTGSRTIDAYRVRNEEATGRTRGIPHPTVFVLDPDGAICAKLRHDGYKTRPTSSDIIEAARALE